MTEKILIIDDDLDTLKLLGLMLQKQGYQVITASNGEQGLAQADAENPDLILLDIMMPAMDGYQVARRLRKTPQTGNIPILVFTAKAQLDDKVAGFEAGADDYLTKPTHPAELSAHVKALLARSGKSKVPAPAKSAEVRAYTVGILAPRGGQGVSTVAVNLGDALRIATHRETIVAELRPGMGTLGPDLGIATPNGLGELLTSALPDISAPKVQEKLYTHGNGLRLLFGSVQPKDGLLPNTPDLMEAIVTHLGTLASYLVLDLGSGLSPLTQKLLPACDVLLVLVELVPNSVVHSRALIANLADICRDRQKIHAVMVNHVRSDTQISMTQLEELLGMPPLIAITPAPELLYSAYRMTTTAVTARPESVTAQQFSKLASEILSFEKQ